MQPDCPKMSDTMIEKAFKVLETHDFVFGPTMDGAFYLVGMKEFYPALFNNKTYSTAQIYTETIAEIEKMGKTWFKLPALVDVDMEEDLGKLRKMIKAEE